MYCGWDCNYYGTDYCDDYGDECFGSHRYRMVDYALMHGGSYDPYNCTCEFCDLPDVFEEGYRFELGDTVEMIQDENLFKELMEYEGEIPNDIKCVLGKKVEIIQVFVDGDYGMKYNNKIFLIKQKCILKDESKSENSKHSESSIEDKNISDFEDAIECGNLRNISALVYVLGPNIKIRDTYPIILAAEHGGSRVVKYLLMKGADVNVKDGTGNSALHLAKFEDEIEICSLLLEYGADVNSLNNHKATPIMLATQGYPNILKLLASRKEADLTLRTLRDETALQLSINSSYPESVEVLLDIGGCPVAADRTRDSPFHQAVRKGNEKIVELFLKKFGASIINTKEDGKNAAIHFAVSKNRIECLKLLIKYKADINIQNDLLETPLHVGVMTRRLDCVKILVENKAKLELEDESGCTPYLLGISLPSTVNLNEDSTSEEEEINEKENRSEGSDKLEDIIEYLKRAGARLDVTNGKSSTERMKDELMRKELIAIRVMEKTEKDAKIGKIQSNNVAVVKNAAEELKELREAVKEKKSNATCKMCNERRRSTVFGCGHTACDICANDLSECRLCHYKIGLRIRMID